jgi:hypothetical protein
MTLQGRYPFLAQAYIGDVSTANQAALYCNLMQAHHNKQAQSA